ncbi:MAG TPA: hypothetical protein VHE13_08080 [Opitutus sp.]|nr:hypothetical protein [Opitutus sp.]
MKSNLRRLARARFLLLSGAVLVSGAALSGAEATQQRADVLEAIHRVENPNDTARPGRHGELGPYQFRRSTWRMHTDEPFAQAVDRAAADAVAIRHYEWIERGLERNGLAATPYNIALAWNGGLRAAVQGRSSAAARNYAERVNNLVQEMRAEQLAVLH